MGGFDENQHAVIRPHNGQGPHLGVGKVSVGMGQARRVLGTIDQNIIRDNKRPSSLNEIMEFLISYHQSDRLIDQLLGNLLNNWLAARRNNHNYLRKLRNQKM